MSSFRDGINKVLIGLDVVLMISVYQYVKILDVCLSVCLCVTEVGTSEGGTTHSYTVTMRPSNLLYLLCTACMCVISSGRTQGAADEADAVGEQQLKWSQSGCTSV